MDRCWRKHRIVKIHTYRTVNSKVTTGAFTTDHRRRGEDSGRYVAMILVSKWRGNLGGLDLKRQQGKQQAHHWVMRVEKKTSAEAQRVERVQSRLSPKENYISGNFKYKKTSLLLIWIEEKAVFR